MRTLERSLNLKRQVKKRKIYVEVAAAACLGAKITLCQNLKPQCNFTKEKATNPLNLNHEINKQFSIKFEEILRLRNHGLSRR